MKAYNKLLHLLLFLLFVNVSTIAQSKKDTLRVLFVGNSYTYFSNLPQLVSSISDSTKTKLITRKSTAGGTFLSTHWNGERGLKTKEMIKNGKFDIVVLQEQSMGAIKQKNQFFKYAKKLCDFIKKHGAKPYFYVTWARKRTPKLQKTITDTYINAAKKNNAKVVLVGEAWALAQKEKPSIELYDPDGSHPSALGSFLTACMFVKSLSKEVPRKLPNTFDIINRRGESTRLKIRSSDIAFCLSIVQKMNKK